MHHQDLQVELHHEPERVVVAARGELDHFTAPLLRDAVVGAAASGWRDIVLDLRGVTFMDAGGAHLLQAISTGLAGDAHFSLVDGVAPVTRLLELLDLADLLPVVPAPAASNGIAAPAADASHRDETGGDRLPRRHDA